MALAITRTTRLIATVTLLVFGAQLSAPATWAQVPATPPSGATPAGPPKPSVPPAAGPATPPAPRAPATREATGNAPWPREFSDGGQTYTAYQPQIEEWDGVRLHARAAFSVESAASPLQHFGVAWFSARAEVDKVNRLVAL